MQKVGCTQQVDNTIQLTSIFLRAQTHLNEQHSPSLELRKTNANTLAKGNAAAGKPSHCIHMCPFFAWEGVAHIVLRMVSSFFVHVLRGALMTMISNAVIAPVV